MRVRAVYDDVVQHPRQGNVCGVLRRAVRFVRHLVTSEAVAHGVAKGCGSSGRRINLDSGFGNGSAVVHWALFSVLR